MSSHATLLIGSPRGPQSTSHALGTYLLDRLKEKGMIVNKVFIQRSLISKGGIDTLLHAKLAHSPPSAEPELKMIREYQLLEKLGEGGGGEEGGEDDVLHDA